MAGTKELKDALALAMSLHMAYDKSMEDGKLSVTDFTNLVDPMMKLLPALEGAKSIPAEMADLDAEEKEELVAWMKANYDLRDDELEAKIEAGLAVVVHIAQFVGALLAPKADDAA